MTAAASIVLVVACLPGCAASNGGPGATRASAPPVSVAPSKEARLQTLVDLVAQRHGLQCSVCGAATVGRNYSEFKPIGTDRVELDLRLDLAQSRVYFTVLGISPSSHIPGPSERVKELRDELARELTANFPELQHVAFVRPYKR